MRRPLRLFAHKLAQERGRLDVDEVLAMPLDKLKELQAFKLIEPFEEDRRDYRMGMTVAALLNPHRKRGAKPFSPSDFMPDWGKRFRAEKLSLPTQINRIMGAFVARFRKPE